MDLNRRNFFKTAGIGAALACTPTNLLSSVHNPADSNKNSFNKKDGNQRLSVKQLKEWESQQYGMFLHFGMSTFTGNELPDGKAQATVFAPDKLDVDQWVSVARDAGMKYAVLTTKHVAGHCLWPTEHTNYSVKNSTNKTDIVGEFIKACERRGIKPGFYYCSWDNHNRFGSKTPSDGGDWKGMNYFPKENESELSPYTTSLYQNFQTAQITELLKNYGPVFEVWIDIPGVLGAGYRTYLYNHIANLQPDTVIMMNSGIGDGTTYNEAYAWPSDLIAIERDRPSAAGYKKRRTIRGSEYYMPGEHCDPIGKEWFYVPDDLPRPDEDLLNQFELTRTTGVNFLLNVPPNKSGLISKKYVDSLMRLRKNAGL
jgi:alpha-L-fucosidase